MAIAGQLIEAVSECFEQPQHTVAYSWRVLRDAGLVTTGARGRGAAAITPLDAARLTIACAADRPQRETLAVYRSLAETKTHEEGEEQKYNSFCNSGIESVSKLPRAHTLEKAISRLIASNLSEFSTGYVLLFGPQPSAKIELFSKEPQKFESSYHDETMLEWLRANNVDESARSLSKSIDLFGGSDLQSTRKFSLLTLTTLSNLFKD